MPQHECPSDTKPCLTLLAPPSLLACLKPTVAAIQGLVVTATPPENGMYWRFETDGGLDVDLPGTAIRQWQRPPFSLLIRLVPSMSGRCEMQEAVIGTRIGLAELQAKITATMVSLLQAAIGGHARSALSPVKPRGAAPAGRSNASFIGGMLRRVGQRMGDWVLVEEWAVGLVHQQLEALLGDEPLRPANWLVRGPGVNLADPHPRIGSNRILCEEFGVDPGPGSARGRIVCLELDRDESAIVDSRVILAGDAHRSYPGSIRLGEDVVFLPETPTRAATELFYLRDDDKLEKLCSIGLPLRMADPTLFEHDGRFWIGYTDLDIGEHDNLCLVYATALTGPWVPHPANPVKIDIRSSRPAGPVIASAGRLYRPAQNCAASYGASLVINRIEELTPQRFNEVMLREITPSASGPYPHGLHTIASRGQSLLIDGKRRVFRSRVLIGKLRRRLRPRMEGVRTAPAAWQTAA